MKLDPTALLGRLGEFQQQMDEKLRAMRVEASAGGNMVTVVCDGYGDLVDVRIDPQVFDERDAGLLEDLVKAAANEAHTRARARAGEELKSLAGFPLPGLFGRH